jgi:hypothetical protein
MPSVLAGAFFGSVLGAVGFWDFKPAVNVRRPHHRDVDSDTFEPDDSVGPTSLHLRLVVQLQTKFDKECNGSCEVVDNNADVVHARKRHTFKDGTSNE